MDRLDAMHMFVRVVETGSFTKVAQEFATTQPTVTKQVAAMETRLKVRLLNRNTRGVSLTEAGGAVLRNARSSWPMWPRPRTSSKCARPMCKASCASAARLHLAAAC